MEERPFVIELPKENEGKRMILKIHGQVFKDAEKLWNIAKDILKEGDVVGKGNYEHVNFAFTGIFAKQMKLYRAIILLCEYGMSHEAQILVRSMFECYLNMKYIEKSEDVVEQSKRFLLWGIALSPKNIATAKIDVREKGKQVIDELTRLNDGFKKEFKNDDEWEKFLRRGPSMKKIWKLAEEVGMKKDYDLLYTITSGVVHSADVHDYVMPIENGIQAFFAPQDNWFEPVLFSAMTFLSGTLESVNRQLKLNKDDKLKGLNDLLLEARHNMKMD